MPGWSPNSPSRRARSSTTCDTLKTTGKYDMHFSGAGSPSAHLVLASASFQKRLIGGPTCASTRGAGGAEASAAAHKAQEDTREEQGRGAGRPDRGSGAGAGALRAAKTSCGVTTVVKSVSTST